MAHEIPLPPEARADDPKYDDARDDGVHEVAADLAYKRLGIVNVAFVGAPGGEWVLVDTGIFGMSAGAIRKAADERFGENSHPRAIIMTHGHFDHVGGVEELAREWQVPVFAHELELPYLSGKAAYPAPDPSVGGGMMALTSPLFPKGPVDVGPGLEVLPADGTLPPMPGWRWIHTPGHTPGHISLFRESDRALIVGDAFVTTNQESVYAAITQKFEMQGPPMYFTQDFEAARASVERLAALGPHLAITGHGRAAKGPHLVAALHALLRNFDEISVPKDGKYVNHPVKPGDSDAYIG